MDRPARGRQGRSVIAAILVTGLIAVGISACGGGTTTLGGRVDPQLSLTALPRHISVPGIGRVTGPVESVAAHNGGVYLTLDKHRVKTLVLAYVCAHAARGLRPSDRRYTVTMTIAAAVRGLHFRRTVTCRTRLNDLQPAGVVHFGPIPREATLSNAVLLKVRGPGSGMIATYYPSSGHDARQDRATERGHHRRNTVAFVPLGGS
jgi:hypothetical protein